MRILILFTALLISSLFADDECMQQDVEIHPDAIPSLINLTSLPSAIVNGCVNVISGDLYEYEQDDTVSGGNSPYMLGHSYASSSLEEGNLGAGWNFLHYHLLEVYQPDRIKYVKKGSGQTPYFYPFEMTEIYKECIGKRTLFPEAIEALAPPTANPSLFAHPLEFLSSSLIEKGTSRLEREGEPAFLSLYEPSGGRLLFKGRYNSERKKGMRHFKLLTKHSGITNVTHGIISGQTNVKNIQLKWDKHKDRFYVKLGDGTKRTYTRQWKYKEMVRKRPHHATYYRDYHLDSEVLPNGNKRLYHYNDKYEVTSVVTYNNTLSQKLSEVTFEQKTPKGFSENPTLHVTTSDKRTHTYSFERLDGKKLKGLYAVSSLDRFAKAKTHFKYSEKDHRGKRRLIEKRTEDGFYIKTEYYKSGRVKCQRSPMGPNGQEIVIHQFFYKDWEDGSGRCSVRDAHNRLTRYYWNKDKRLKAITKLDEQKNMLMHEEFYWSDNYTYNKGNLRAHVIKDEQNAIRLVRKFNYDGRGNIVKNILIGRVTKNEGNIQFNDDLTYTYSSDRLETTYTYSDDGFNLKKSECDPNGNYTYYDYVPGTNLLMAKFVCDKNTIRKREFFTYDENGLITEHIFDDGSSWDRDCLDDVTERHKKECTSRLEMPHFGEALETGEYYYDFSKSTYVRYKSEQNTFDDRGRIIQKAVIDHNGNAVRHHYEYDDADRLIQIIDPLGNRETLTYDPITARLISKKSTRDDVSWHYIYDPMGHVVKETEVHNNGLELTTEYEYDHLGRKIAVKDAQNNITRYQYDSLDRVTEIIYPDLYDHTGKKITPKKTYSYKYLGSEVTETDEIGLSTTTYYSVLGKITDQNFPDGSCKKCTYDLKGNVIEEVAPNGSTTKMFYDGFDRLVESHQAGVLCKKIIYNSFHAIEEFGPTGEHTLYSYNPAGMLIRKQQDERSTLYSYDDKMRLKEERINLTDGYIATGYLYDDLNRLIQETLSDHTSDLRTYTAYEYDQEGNQSAIIQNIGGQEAKTKSSYYPHALPESCTDAEGNSTLYSYNYRYKNQHGQTVICRQTIDPRGCIFEELFDARGNISSICLRDPMGILLAKKLQFYDAANNLIRIEEHALSQSGNNTITTLFEYTQGHLSSLIEAAGTPEQKKTEYFYNNSGELEVILHADGTVLRHTYDVKGRLAHFYSNDCSIDYSYRYDGADRLIEVFNGTTGKTTTRTYNGFGELISETLETGLTTIYAYDYAGHLQELTLPDSSKIAYERSSFLDSISRKNADNQVIYTHAILERDLSGLINSAQLPLECGKIAFTHDALGRNRSIAHRAFEQKTEQFDPSGNLLHLLSKDPIGKTERSFRYDYLSQLIQETGPSSHSYSYDSLYNRLKIDDASYTANSLHSVLSDSKHAFTYDARGNRQKMQSDTGTVSYVYDALDRLIEVITPESRYSYRYDPFNRRLSKNDDEFYLYVFDNEIGKTDAKQTIKELRILGEGLGAEIGASIALELDGETYIPLHDRQGNIAILLDSSGKSVETYRYDAFGNELTSGAISPWRFSSKRVDPETGLVNFGRRYYDPRLGKWLTQDPLGLKAGPNLYAYVLNGPMTRFDEYGLSVELEKDQCERVYSRNGNHVVLERSYTTYSFDGDHDYSSARTQQRSIVKSEFISAGDLEILGIYILSVNGILNNKVSAQDNLNYLSFSGDNVKLQGLWNATHGPFDLFESILQTKLGFYSPTSRLLRDKLMDIQLKDPKATILVTSFSQGAAVVKGALQLSEQNIRDMVISIAFGPAEIVPSGLCKESKNYISKNDIVTYLGDPTGILLNRDCIEFVDAHPNAPSFPFDHSFQSLTYQRIIKRRLRDYIKTYRQDNL